MLKGFVCLTEASGLARILKTVFWSGYSWIRSILPTETDRCMLLALYSWICLFMRNCQKQLISPLKWMFFFLPIMKSWSQLNISLCIVTKKKNSQKKQKKKQTIQPTKKKPTQKTENKTTIPNQSQYWQYSFIPKQNWRHPQKWSFLIHIFSYSFPMI